MLCEERAAVLGNASHELDCMGANCRIRIARTPAIKADTRSSDADTSPVTEGWLNSP
jgi:hypothetical protein